MSKKTKDVTPALLKSVPIMRTELSTFDDSLSFLKEKFVAEMQRMDEEMNRFSLILMDLYGQQSSSNEEETSREQLGWDVLANSPLIEEEGNTKLLKLQFDVSAFEPADVKVEIINDKLVVSAHHEQITDNTNATREFRREFILPLGINPDLITSSLSRDGILSVQAPLPEYIITPDLAKPSKEVKKGQPSLTKNPQEPMLLRSSAEFKSRTAQEEPAIMIAPASVTGQVPQAPMALVSPAAPTMPTNPDNPPVTKPKKKPSKTAGKTATKPDN